MVIKGKLNHAGARVAVALVTMAVCALLSFIVLSQFVVSVMTDPQTRVSTAMLRDAASYFSDSSGLHARLAARLLEAGVDDSLSYEQAATLAEEHASRAVALAPWSYECRMLLSSAKELKGDLAAAEESARAARRLAPHYTEVHWRLANLLLRMGKLNQSLDEFCQTVAVDPSRLPQTLKLVWNVSDGNLEAMRAVVGNDPALQLGLAQFLLKQSRVTEAADLFRRIDLKARLSSSTSSSSSEFLNDLVAAGQIELAHSLWLDLMNNGAHSSQPLVWNGGFEAGILKGFDQFDWAISQSQYARIAITADIAHSGTRSLRIDFAGRDTTRLDEEIKQLILVTPGVRYRLECFVKTEGLLTPEGPRLAVSNGHAAPLAVSEAVAAGTHDWQLYTMDFTAPTNMRSLLLTIKRIPRFSYDDPTRGTIWFDDFTLQEH